MEVIYKLTEREREFLTALGEKEYPKFAYSGRISDDGFRRLWSEEIITFKDNDLFERVDNGEGAYWEYELNIKGMKLYNQLIQSATELKEIRK